MSKVNKIIEIKMEIIKLAHLVTMSTKADVFVNYSGHVGWLEIEIHSKGWFRGSIPDKYFRIRDTSNNEDCGTQDEVIKELNEAVKFLKSKLRYRV